MYSYIWNTGDKVLHDALEGAPQQHQVAKMFPILWREHCMECAMPLCYKTCPLFKSRMDGRCLLFARGITPVKFDGLSLQGARIEFRRWGKMQACLPYSLRVVGQDRCESISKAHKKIEYVARKFCDGIHQYRLAQITASLLERLLIRKRYKNGTTPDGFLAVVKNEEPVKKDLMLEILQGSSPICRMKFELNPGWNETFIPMHRITMPSDVSKSWFIRAFLNPDETAVLTFAYFDFVSIEKNESAEPASKVKCVAWDLDNTLWNGVIGDDDADNVQVNKEALTLIRQLDERGILQTIASKNNFDIAWSKIVELGLDDMFLYPAINWGQKSTSIHKIAEQLNIGVDTFALIDDSSFERAEVSTALPEVRVYDAVDIPTLLNNPEFDVPVSEESRHRRQSYLNEAKRIQLSENYGGKKGDYVSFLRACELEMSIFTPTCDVEQTRCLELLQRSNQYNVSGNRYNQDEFQQLLGSHDNKCLAFRVRDRFGDYGIVGFASLETNGQDLHLKDFVMSCRVAMKHIERAFIHALVNSPLFANRNRLLINVVKTDRNKPLREQLLQMPFDVIEDNNSNLRLSLDKSVIFDDEDIVRIIVK